jgi:hypothetical protein
VWLVATVPYATYCALNAFADDDPTFHRITVTIYGRR